MNYIMMMPCAHIFLGAVEIENVWLRCFSSQAIPWVFLSGFWEMARRQWSCGSVDKGMALVQSRNTGSPQPDIDVDSLIEVF